MVGGPAVERMLIVWRCASAQPFVAEFGGIVMAIIYGTDSADSLDGTAVADTINGLDGDDIINGLGGNDQLVGGSGRDNIYGGAGDDTLRILSSNDLIVGEKYDGGAGADTLRVLDEGIDLSVVDLVGIEGIDRGSGGVSLTAAQLTGLSYLSGWTFTLTTAGSVRLAGNVNVISFYLAAGTNVFDLTGSNSSVSQITGNIGIDTIIGSNDSETISGDDGNDNLYGGEGEDQLNGGIGDDSLFGGANRDWFSGGEGADRLSGGDGDDSLYGGVGKDIIRGEAGDDYIIISERSDVVAREYYDGGAGHDVLNLNFETDADLSAVSLVDIERVSRTYYSYDIVLTAEQLDNLSSISSRSVTLATAGSITFFGEVDVETFNLAAGTNFFDLTGSSNRVLEINGNGGADTIIGADNSEDIYGYAGDDNVAGGIGADRLFGGDGADILSGGEHMDNLDGGRGLDVIEGGDGDDYIHITAIEDLVAGEQYDGGDGIDTLVIDFAGDVDLSKISLSGIERISQAFGGFSVTMTAKQLDGLSYIDVQSVTLTTAGSVALSGSIYTWTFNLAAGSNNFDLSESRFGVTVNGNYGIDVITGTIGPDRIYGSDGDDVISGGGERDLISGGAGLDVINGGVGNDIILIDNADDLVFGEIYDGGEGDDYFFVNGPGDVDLSNVNLIGVEELGRYYENGGSGRYDVALRAEQFNGLSYISGKSFTLTTPGSITLSGDISATLIRLAAGDNYFDLTGSNGRVFGIDGNVGADTIKGSSGTQSIDGAEGDDSLAGAAGDDWLDGGSGRDRLFGGDGSDILDADESDDLLDGGVGRDTVNYWRAQAGVIVNLATQQLGNGGTILGVENLEGSSYDDVLTGDAGSNIISGDWGNDVISGGAGTEADRLEGGDDIDFGDFILRFDDTVSYADVRAGVVVDLNLTTAQETGGGGRDTLIGFESVIGSAFADKLVGAADADRLTGGSGNDLLIGGLGDDHLEGGAGIDTADYAATATAVVVDLQAGTASGGAGNDTLVDVENLIGTRLNDVLTGNAGANSLQGGLGDDVLSGGAGEDLLDGGGGTDLASYADAASAVTVNLRLATRQNTLGAGVDTLIGIENLEGSAYNDTLVGNGGANVLTGGAGIDTADYAGAASAVRVSLAVAGRQNTLGDGVDTLAGIENLNGTGFDDQLTGDAGNNRLTGNNGNDLLVGGLGDDFLSGGAGTDTVSYAGLAAGVTVHLGITAAQDTVAGGVDTLISIETLVGTSYADKLTGNAFANSISGGNGDDTIDAGGGGAGYGDTLDGGLGNDSIKGGGGADIIIGGSGIDLMTGGVGNDRFVFNAATDSRVGRTLTDRITDFTAGDILDLSGIDANAGTTGANEAFTQVAAFTKAAGELTLAFDAATNTTTLNADTTGDGIADFSVLFTGNVAPAVAANWVL